MTIIFMLLLSVFLTSLAMSSMSTLTPMYVFSQVMSVDNITNTDTDYTNIEILLASEINIARCQASCIKNFSPCSSSSSCTQCKRVCRLLQETPAWGNVCSAPGLCKEGCQVACHGREQGDRMVEEEAGPGMWQIRIMQCSLVWRVQEQSARGDKEHLMFLVAAKDKEGMFYHVATVSATSVKVPQDILQKAEKLVILSIAENNIKERHQILVEPRHQECEAPQWSSLSDPLVSQIEEEFPTIPIIILCMVVTLLVVATMVLVKVVTQHCTDKHGKNENNSASKKEKDPLKPRKICEGRSNPEYCGFEIVDPTVMKQYHSSNISKTGIYISTSVLV